MFIRNLFPFMAPEDEASGGGAAVLDRGDDLDDKLPPSTIDDSKEVEDKAKELLGDDEDDKKVEDEPARGKDGKFAKREVPDHVPKARFDDAVGKERAAREAAEQRAAEAEARLKQEQKSDEVAKMETDIEALEAKHSKAILDGEHEAAAKLMKEIRMAERKIADLENGEKLTRATSQAVEQVRMDAAIARLEADYPILSQESEDFDEEMVDLVLAEQRRLMSVERIAPSAALTKAANKIMKKFSGVTAKAAEEDKPKGLDAAKGAVDRKADQVAKNIDTAKRQPSSSKDSGKDSDKHGLVEGLPDISKMSKEEIDALPESTKRKLRGDSV